MVVEAHSLAQLADLLRSEAGSGLYWKPGAAEAARLHALRDLAAALLSEVDLRPTERIKEIFEADRGLRTPTTGLALRFECADGRIVRRHWRLTGAETLSELLSRIALTAHAAIGPFPTGVVDSFAEGLACHHTYLIGYSGTSGLVSSVLEAHLPDTDTDYMRIAGEPAWQLASRASVRMPAAAGGGRRQCR